MFEQKSNLIYNEIQQHGVLVVEGSNPSVPTNEINELQTNTFQIKILGYTFLKMTTILLKPYLFIFLAFSWIFISPITEAANPIKIDSEQINHFFLPHTLVHEFKSKTNGVRYNLYTLHE